MMKRYYCTYFDRNYLVKALALIGSLAKHESRPYELLAVCFDEISRTLLRKLALPNVVPIPIHEIEEGDEALLAARSNRSLVEYYWTSTPTIILRLLERNPEIDLLTYLDSDLFFFNSPQPIFDEFGDRSILLHEHRFPASLKHLEENGRFNVGLMMFRNDARALTALKWWREQCLAWCHAKPEGGKMGDQGYLNDWPTRFQGVWVLQNIGAGVAPWNHVQYRFSRSLDGTVLVDGTPLIFYHYHSLVAVQPDIILPTRHTVYGLTPQILRHCFVPYADALRNGYAAMAKLSSGLNLGTSDGREISADHVFLAHRSQLETLTKSNLPHKPLDAGLDWIWFVPESLKAIWETGSDAGYTAAIGQPSSISRTPALAQGARQDDPSALVQYAAAQLELNRIEEFETALGRALELDPHHRGALKLLADLNFQNGKWKDAGECYVKILTRTPDDLETLLGLATCFLKADDFETAQVVYEKILQISPGHPAAKENLAVIEAKTNPQVTPVPVRTESSGAQATRVDQLLSDANARHQQGDLVGTRAILAEAARLAPEDPEVLASFGAVLFKLNEFSPAQEKFQKVTRLQPSNTTAFLQLALANLRLERIEEFEIALGRALEIDPYHRDALKLLADLSLEHGSLKDAAQSYTKIITKHPDDLDALLPLGVCFFKAGDFETARAVFERVLEVDPGNALAKENIEIVLRKSKGEETQPSKLVPLSSTLGPGQDAKREPQGQEREPASANKPDLTSTNARVSELLEQAHFFNDVGNREAALESLEQAAELSPRDPNILAALGSFHFSTGNYDIAREKFRRVIELRPRDVDAYTRLAMTCLKLNRIEEMESALGIALEIDPENREALKFLGKTNLENNRARDAGRVYAKLLEKQPDDIESLLSLGLCFYRGGDLESARMVYERVLEVDPGNSMAHENLLLLDRKAEPIASFSAPKSESFAQPANKPQKLKHWLSKADEAFGNQNLAAARDALKAALALSPDTPEILSALGTVCFQLGEIADAKSHLQTLARQVPNDAGHWVRLALTHYQLGEIAEFEAALGRALELDPNHLEALRMLAHLNFNHASIAAAAQQYGKILKQTPDDIETIMALGVCFFKLRDYKSAKMMFERILELQPNHSLAQENLRAASLKLEPSNTQTPTPSATPISQPKGVSVDEFLGRANACLGAGDLQGACHALRQASALVPDDADVRATLGTLLFQAGDWQSSEQELAQAVRLRPRSADFQTRWALSLLTLDRISEFESALGSAMDLDPNHIPALRLLADLNLQQGKYKDAADTYFRVLRQEPDNVDVILAMGVCFYRTGDLPAARLMYERVLHLQPANTIARENLDVLHREARKTEAAPSSVPNPPIPKEPLVSAIVSAYKAERFMRGCLEDLEGQTIADQIEIIVVDTGSPQKEGAIVEEFQQRYNNIVYLRTEERETVYAAWNRAIRVARGKYLTNANTDDRHRKDAFEILMRKLDENPHISLVYADVIITDEENKTFGTARQIGAYSWLEFDREALVKKGCFVGPQPMWRRTLHDQHGYFDPAFVSAGDYEFWMRIAKTTEFLRVPQTLGVYLKSPTSVEHANQPRAVEETRIAHERHAVELLKIAGVDPTAFSVASYATVTKIEAPPGARLGSLKDVHDLLARKKYARAWKAALDAISLRPFHPDAYLQMIEIALAGGDDAQAFQCAERLIRMTPDWDMARKIYVALQKPQKGKSSKSKIKWAPLPALPERPRLTVCLIAKNEEQFIGRCLASIKPMASQIVVVDTGSTDRTVEIAKEHGAEVYYFAWNDNFSDARNAAHEHARGDWVLILDADEEMPPESHTKLAEDMAATNVLGYRIPICNVHEASDCVTYVPRLFRNAPALFFVGRVHEQIYASVIARKAEWGMEAKLGTATIVHHGYDPGLVKRRQKIQRNLKLMEKAVQEMPNEAALLMNYGLDLVNDGRLEEGLEKYREAVRVMEPHPPELVLPEVRERLVTIFGVHLTKANRYDELLKLMTSRLALDSGPTASMSFLAGLALMRLNRSVEAIAHFRSCLANRNVPTLTPPCPEALKEGPHHLLAECLSLARQFEEAETEFKHALELAPRSGSVLHDYARFLHDRNRSFEAIQLLHGAIAQDLNEERIWFLGGYIANSKPEFIEFALDWTAEAIKYHSEHEGISGLRGETLLKAGQFSEALPWFQKAAHASKPAGQAAIIMCELGTSGNTTVIIPPEQESLVSREFIGWYRRLLASSAKNALSAVNAQMGALRRILPTAVTVLEQAFSEAESS